MNRTDFEQLVEKKLSECQRVLGLKAANYAHSAVTEDRLNNFKTAGKLQGCSPETALGGMISKHLVAIFDLIKMIERDEPLILAEWDEKITDSINYLLLLWALVNERKNAGGYILQGRDSGQSMEPSFSSPAPEKLHGSIEKLTAKEMHRLRQGIELGQILMERDNEPDEIARMREKGTVE